MRNPVNDKAVSKDCKNFKRVSPLPASFAGPWAAIGGQESTKTSQQPAGNPIQQQTSLYHTWKALRSRKTRSYASLGGNRFKASRTVSDSSGIRSSALSVLEVSPSFHIGPAICDAEFPKNDNWITPFPFLDELSVDYLRPSFLYPAASAYQLARGIIQRFNHGLLTMYPASDGADIIASG